MLLLFYCLSVICLRQIKSLSVPITPRISSSFRLPSSSSELPSKTLVETVQRTLLRAPMIDSGLDLDPNVEFSSPLFSLTGASAYTALRRDWEVSWLPRLSRSTFTLLRVAPLGQNKVIVSWNVSFVSESSSSLAAFFERVPGVKLTYFDILHREKFRSSFSWNALLRTLNILLTTGELRLPLAVILGTSELTFQRDTSDDGRNSGNSAVLIKQKDSLNLLRSLDIGVLKNRKLTLDLLEFLDACRPSSLSLDVWNERIASRVSVSGVPGMSQFDIDGLDSAASPRENADVVVSNVGKLAIPVVISLALFSTYLLNVFLFTSSQEPPSIFY